MSATKVFIMFVFILKGYSSFTVENNGYCIFLDESQFNTFSATNIQNDFYEAALINIFIIMYQIKTRLCQCEGIVMKLNRALPKYAFIYGFKYLTYFSFTFIVLCQVAADSK